MSGPHSHIPKPKEARGISVAMGPLALACIAAGLILPFAFAGTGWLYRRSIHEFLTDVRVAFRLSQFKLQ
jgi:hypothetical protein